MSAPTIDVTVDWDEELGLNSTWEVRAVGPHAALPPREIPPPPCSAKVTWGPDANRSRMRLNGAQILRDRTVVKSAPVGPVNLNPNGTLTLIWDISVTYS